MGFFLSKSSYLHFMENITFIWSTRFVNQLVACFSFDYTHIRTVPCSLCTFLTVPISSLFNSPSFLNRLLATNLRRLFMPILSNRKGLRQKLPEAMPSTLAEEPLSLQWTNLCCRSTWAPTAHSWLLFSLPAKSQKRWTAYFAQLLPEIELSQFWVSPGSFTRRVCLLDFTNPVFHPPTTRRPELVFTPNRLSQNGPVHIAHNFWKAK